MLLDRIGGALKKAKTQIRVIDFSPKRRLCGVYLLVLNETVVYVGQTTDIDQRINAHIDERKKAFNKILFIECDPENDNFDSIEWELIQEFKPEHNGKSPCFNYRSQRRSRAVLLSAIDYLKSKGEFGATMNEIAAAMFESKIWWIRDFGKRLALNPAVVWDQSTLRFYHREGNKVTPPRQR